MTKYVKSNPFRHKNRKNELTPLSEAAYCPVVLAPWPCEAPHGSETEFPDTYPYNVSHKPPAAEAKGINQWQE